MSEATPDGWTLSPISDVVSLNPKHPRDLDERLPVAFIPMPCISESQPDFERREERLLGEVRKGYTHFADGDVLFAKITPCMENGKGAVARNLLNGRGCGTTELHVLRPSAAINSYYLYYFLFQEKIRQDAAHNFTGSAGQLRVPLSFVSELVLPIPPLAEQQRIVAVLDAVLANVASCRERLARIPTLLKRFRQAVLAAACSGRLTADWREQRSNAGEHYDAPEATEIEVPFDVPVGWNWTRLNSLCDDDRGICYGVIKLGGTVDRGVPCLRTSDVRWLRIDETDVKRISPDISDDYQRSILRGGEVLVNVRGTLGGVAVVPLQMRGWNVSREVAVVPIESADPAYVARWIGSSASQGWLTGVAKGVAYTGINLSDLRLLPIAMPSLPEQQEIVRRVDALFAVADQLEARYEQARRHVDRLAQSVLAKAFRGELVPTEHALATAEGRDYESAAQLLKRIRTVEPPPAPRRKRAARRSR